MVSTPFGLKFSIVFLCYGSVGAITKRPIKKAQTNQAHSTTRTPTQLHSVLNIKKYSKVFCFLEAGSGNFFNSFFLSRFCNHSSF